MATGKLRHFAIAAVAESAAEGASRAATNSEARVRRANRAGGGVLGCRTGPTALPTVASRPAATSSIRLLLRSSGPAGFSSPVGVSNPLNPSLFFSDHAMDWISTVSELTSPILAPFWDFRQMV